MPSAWTIERLGREAASLALLALAEAGSGAGPRQDPLEELLAGVLRRGARTLHRLTRQALVRLLAHGPAGVLGAANLFAAVELAELAAVMAATQATAGLLGRALVRDKAARAAGLRESVQAPAPLAVPFIRQSTSYSCGAACLAAVCRFHGLNVNEADIGRALGTDSRDGTRPAEIVAVARRLGLQVREADHLPLAALAKLTAQGWPVVSPIQAHGGGHWVVVTGLDADRVCLMDPVAGDGYLPREEFESRWYDADADGVRYRRYGIALGSVEAGVGQTSLAGDAMARQEQRAVLASEACLLDAGRAQELIPLPEALSVPLAPLSPEAAVAYFAGLVPELGIDPRRFGPDLRRRAFTLATATSRDLLTRVQDLVRSALQTGQRYTEAPRDISQLLADAGVSPRHPGYAEAVFRTNAMDAYTTASEEARTDPDVIDAFPVWVYSNPADGRSRPEHAARDGNYYPAGVSFNQVRGTAARDVINCRCVPIPVDKWEWSRLRRAGARVAEGYPDVPDSLSTHR